MTPGSDEHRAVMTGLGAVSCLGAGLGGYWNALLAGGAAPREVDLPHLNMRARRMYRVPEAAVPEHPRRHAGVPLGAVPRMAVAAALEALDDAGIEHRDRADVPVVLGCEMGNASVQEERRGADGAGHPQWTPLAVAAAAVGSAIGSRRGNISVGNACSAGGYALGIASDLIRSGEASVVLVGAADGVTRVGMGGFDRLGAADPHSCRPFARDRAGTVFGDGAAMVVLESAAHARLRGVRAYAELAGVAWSCDARHPTAPDPDATQLVRAMREALADADLAPDRVGCVLPHATGTPLNDAVESRALRRVFGQVTDRLPLFALKAMIGHTSAAAGIFACLTSALILSRARIPANAPVEQDPDCEVWLPREAALRPARPAVLVNTCAFGGNNSSFVLAGRGWPA
ncbi:beta-ketoacyl synthase N-terminal-like domain-containing protein [Embleya sp. NPDC005971]|uniref:beta-ketoacyl-[acyl-carrier-protein] synthase family protein n=1 Tax=Embleya sp. NPDC005971 TaxID=3156724 RepID=UPI0033D0DC72